MFGPAGHAYVYMIHSRWCLNAVTEPESVPSAILIRAIEPMEAIRADAAAAQNGHRSRFARGPARLCEALAIDRTYNGWDLAAGRELWIAADPDVNESRLRIARSGRIGLSSAQRRLLRFYLADNRFVSGRVPHAPT